MNKLFNKAVLNGTTIMGDGLTYPRIPNVYTGGNEGGYQRGDMMDANAVVEMIKELTDTGKITIDELKNLINEEIQERVEGDQDQQRYTDEKIKDLIGTSPETLDTLKEIADALGEDPDFAANVWNKLAEVDQTLEDYKRASNLPKYVVSEGMFSPIVFEQTSNGIDLNIYRTDLDTGDTASKKITNIIPNATNSMPGFMSAADKQKVDYLPEYIVGHTNSSGRHNIFNPSRDSYKIYVKYDCKKISSSDEITSGFWLEQADQVKAGLMSSFDKKKLDSIENYYAGNGIDITGHRISCTLDTSLYSIVTELPETGLPNKIYLLPSTKTEEGNIYTEYGYVDNKWEEIGKYKADVNLEPYKRALHLPTDVIKTLGVQSGANYVNVYSYKEDLDRGVLSEVSEFDIPKATSEKAGIITAQDKAKLDGIEAGAQVNTIESVSVNGTPLGITNKGVDIPNATTEQDGMMSANDKSKLDSFDEVLTGISQQIAEKANNVDIPKSISFTRNDYNPDILSILLFDSAGNRLFMDQLYLQNSANSVKLITKDYHGKALLQADLNVSPSDNNLLKIDGNGYCSVIIPNATPSKTGLMSANDKSKLDSQPTIKANDATRVTNDDYVVIKKSELDSILSRLSALENKA